MPQDLVRIFDRDIVAAGTARPDPAGPPLPSPPALCRGSDDWASYSLRHTFATLLSKCGVVPRMAQELMRGKPVERRHPRACAAKLQRSSTNAYTHLHLADTAGAFAALPSIGLVQPATNRQRMTGTDR